MLTLHIGLPKTASTFLQYQVFNQQSHHFYIDNIVLGPIHKAIRRYVRASDEDAASWRREIVRLIPEGDVLLSDENIAMDAREPWTGQGFSSGQTATRLSALAEEFGVVRIILGIRRQDRWFASRYSESAGVFGDFNQADFDERVIGLCRSGPSGVLRWLDYYEAWRVLTRAVGEDNVLLLPQEILAENPTHALRGLERFLGVSDLVRAYRSGALDSSYRNVLASGSNRWRLRDHAGGVLVLSDTASELIRARFADGNRRIPGQDWLRFREHGYY